jgi:hypothetical protein
MKITALAATLALLPAVAAAGGCPAGMEPEVYVSADGKSAVTLLPDNEVKFSTPAGTAKYRLFQEGQGWGYASHEKDGHPWWSVEFDLLGQRLLWNDEPYFPDCR